MFQQNFICKSRQPAQAVVCPRLIWSTPHLTYISHSSQCSSGKFPRLLLCSYLVICCKAFHWALSHHGPCLRPTGRHGHLVLLGNLWGPFFREAEKRAKKEGSQKGRNPPLVGLWLSRLLRSAPQALPAAAASAHSSSAESESTSDSDSSSDSESESSSSDSEENEPREAPAPEVLGRSRPSRELGSAVEPRWPGLPGGGAFRPPCTLLAIRVYLFLGVGLWNFGRDVISLLLKMIGSSLLLPELFWRATHWEYVHPIFFSLISRKKKNPKNRFQ